MTDMKCREEALKEGVKKPQLFRKHVSYQSRPPPPPAIISLPILKYNPICFLYCEISSITVEHL